MKEALVFRLIFNGVPMLWDAMLVSVYVLCVCVSVWTPDHFASLCSAAIFSLHGNLAHWAKIKTSLSSLFIKNNRLQLLSLLFSLSLPLPLAASSAFLPSLSTGDWGEVCFNYWTTFHIGGERWRHTSDAHCQALSTVFHTYSSTVCVDISFV